MIALFSDYVTIGDIADVKGGKRLPRGMSVQDEPTAHPYIRVVDFTDDGLDRTNIKYITDSTYDKIKRYTISSEDIYISIAGTIGRVGIVPKDLSGANLTENAAKISNIDKSYDRQFLVYYLRSPQGQAEIFSKIVGTSQPKLALFRIKEIRVPKVHLPTQRKIAAILSGYDDLIENNTRRIKNLEEMAQLIYREWFVKFRFPGHEKVRMVDSELGPIPEGWEVKRLSDLVDTQYGYTESARELPVGPKYLRGTDINKNSYIDWDKVPFCPITDEDYKKYKLKQGDILIIRMADPGKVGIVEQSVEAVFASYLIRLKIKSLSVAPYYLFYFMLSDRYQNYINGASTGTTRKSASASVITDISLVIPPKEIIYMFEEIIMGYRKFLNILLKQNTLLRRTRDLLLPRLISGELDVEDLDIAVGGD